LEAEAGFWVFILIRIATIVVEILIATKGRPLDNLRKRFDWNDVKSSQNCQEGWWNRLKTCNLPGMVVHVHNPST
jgi:hypothetical protein